LNVVGVWEVFIFGTCHVSLCDDGVYHSILIHVIVELLISCYFDSDKLFVGCIGNLVSMSVEDLDDTVPFVKVPSESYCSSA
jgi:hypothetical protein